MKPLFLSLFLFISSFSFGQGLISSTFNSNELSGPDGQSKILGCGSHQFVKHQDRQANGYENNFNELSKQVSKIVSNQNESSRSSHLITIPVVFHVVYSKVEQNLADSVIKDQLRILNESFRRTNKDTGNTRAVFKNVVGDTEIEFVMASTDPQGKPTNGVTRTSTSITHFGGILPYNRSQTAQIQKWVADSLFYNYFRITDDKLGGKSEWDAKSYLNIWIGDLRIFEPKLNNFEEVLLLGMATNPKGHKNWPDSVLPNYITAQGAIIHYVCVASNNPTNFVAPYAAFNASAKGGKVTVHEVGHFYGLRHIWGDGDCTKDDFISDTPNAANNSNWGCVPAKNTCSETPEVPDMIENYMDYSNASCQNAFTKEQGAVMREVYKKYRSKQPAASAQEFNNGLEFKAFPNPTNGELNIQIANANNSVMVTIIDLQGRIILSRSFNENEKIQLNLDTEAGIYFVKLNSGNNNSSFRVVKK